MKLGINQAYFLPYIGYFQLIKSVDKFMLYELLHFRLQGWINRNRILVKSSGRPMNINIPISKKSPNLLIRDARLADNKNFMLLKIIKKIKHNYSKAKYFDETIDFLETAINNSESSKLNTFNGMLIQAVCQHLDIHTDIQIDNGHYMEMERELEEYNSLQQVGDAILPKKVKRVIMICQKENADTFVNLPGGQTLYNPEVFARENINFHFISPPQFEYNQFDHPFVPHLSILDVLMHCGQKRTIEMVNSYKFISA